MRESDRCGQSAEDFVSLHAHLALVSGSQILLDRSECQTACCFKLLARSMLSSQVKELLRDLKVGLWYS